MTESQVLNFSGHNFAVVVIVFLHDVFTGIL